MLLVFVPRSIAMAVALKIFAISYPSNARALTEQCQVGRCNCSRQMLTHARHREDGDFQQFLFSELFFFLDRINGRFTAWDRPGEQLPAYYVMVVVNPLDCLACYPVSSTSGPLVIMSES